METGPRKEESVHGDSLANDVGQGERSDPLVRLYLTIRRDKIGFFKFLLEGYDGLATLSTMDAAKGSVLLTTPRSRYREVIELLAHLSASLVVKAS